MGRGAKWVARQRAVSVVKCAELTAPSSTGACCILTRAVLRMAESSSTDARDADEALQNMLDAGYQTRANRITDHNGKYCCIPLSAAASAGCIRAVDMLLQAGALANAAKRNTHEVPLHIAAWNGHIDIIRALVAAGADVHARTSSGWIPLCCAASGPNLNAVKELLRSGANPNALSHDEPLLHSLVHSCGQHYHSGCADISKRLRVLQLLLEAGAKVNALDKYGRTPMQLLLETNSPEFFFTDWHGGVRPVLDMLLSAGARLNISAPLKGCLPSVAHYALNADDFDLLHVYIQRGEDVNVHSWRFATPLYVACSSASVHTVALLLQAGARTSIGSWTDGQGIISEFGLAQIALLFTCTILRSAVERLVNCPNVSVGTGLTCVFCIDFITITQ